MQAPPEKPEETNVPVLLGSTSSNERLRSQNDISKQKFSAKTGKEIPPYPILHSVSTPILDDYPMGITALMDTPVLYIECEETIHNDRGKFHIYRVVDAFGRYLYKVEESSSRHGSSRPFEVSIIDVKKQIVFNIRRRTNCCLCFLGSKCYGNNVQVYKMDGELIGEIKQIWGKGFRFRILDGKGSVVMLIEGPPRISCFCPFARPKDPMNLLYLDLDHPSEPYSVGTFNVVSDFSTKEFKGIVFGMQFPYEFPCELKALVLAAGIMIDFTFCETQSSFCFSWYGSGFLTVVFALMFCTLIGLCAWYFCYYKLQ